MDGPAFEQLYRANWPRVFAYLRRRCTPEDAEDLAELTFLQAWRKRDSYTVVEGKEAVRWLYRIAHNLYVEFMRALRPALSLEQQLSEPGAVQPFSVEDRDELERALQLLSQIQQTVLRLRYFEDLSTAQIAAYLTMRDGAVRGVEFRAIHTLRERWLDRFSDLT